MKTAGLIPQDEKEAALGGGGTAGSGLQGRKRFGLLRTGEEAQCGWDEVIRRKRFSHEGNTY